MAPANSNRRGGNVEYLCDEDLELKQRLELYVERLQDSDSELQRAAIVSMRQEIRTATSSISLPKPLKFLRPHYGTLQAHYDAMTDSDLKKLLADILSVLAWTMCPEKDRECLKYRLYGSDGDIWSWGHEYVRNLTGVLVQEDKENTYQDLDVPIDDIIGQIVAFHMKHNAEPEAVDLLLELDYLELLLEHVDNANYKRTCLYLTSLSKYLTDPEDMLVLDYAHTFYTKFEEYPRALHIALKLNNFQIVSDIFQSCHDPLTRKQLCFILARHGVTFVINNDMSAEDEESEALQELINNTNLSEGYLTLARDVDVMEPKSPEDIYKAHPLDVRGRGEGGLSSIGQNLAGTIINAFVNAGFGQDKLMTVPSEASSGSSSTSWVDKNVEHGKACAVASLGMIMMWDVDSGLAQLDKYLYGTDTHVTAGALLGVGIVNCNVQHQSDPGLALLAGYIGKEDSSIRIGAIMGLGLAYAGSRDLEVKYLLKPILEDGKTPLDVLAFTAISLSLVYVGSCKKSVANAIIQPLRKLSDSESGHPLARFLPLSLGLLYLGKKERVEYIKHVPDTLNLKIRKYCAMTLQSCAYAGTGDVLKVQYFLGQCAHHLQKGVVYQRAAVLGIAMVAMAEELGLEMAIRSLEHLLQYGEPNIRGAVPLALGLLCISNPKVNVTDILSRLSHDADKEVAMAAIISLGLIGAGTNNARIAGMLCKLSSYYYRDGLLLLCVRFAQGLVYLGKGLLTLSPYHSERFLFSQTALAGLVIFLHACLDMEVIILRKYHYVMYFLALAMQPRMVMTVDENLKPLSVPVRVGQAVDIVGQAGRPRTLTGCQNHSTPVLLSADERAELATDKYIPLSPVLEGFVILKENPEYKKEK